MKTYLIVLVLMFLCFQHAISAQVETVYEVEILTNPNAGKKDTRQVNAKIIFGKETVKVVSRRNSTVFKEFKYTEIVAAEHSRTKKRRYKTAALISLVSPVVGLPFLLATEKKHWLLVRTDKDFFYLKVEKDNHRLIQAEFEVRNVEVHADDDSPKAKSKEK